jgi:beta-galactosidase
MKAWSRRDVLRGAAAGAAAALTPKPLLGATGDAEFPEAMTAATTGMPHGERLRLDAGWKFHLGHACDPAKDFGYGAASRERPFAKAGHVSKVTSANFDDSQWQNVTLPHDWAIELPFVATKPLPEQGAKPFGREYPETSIGWYRRSFKVDAADSGKRFTVEFDGIMRAATIFCNGHYVGENFSGYAPCRFDLTDWINFGERNTLVVRSDVSSGEGWFYEGAGIYRHVWLTITEPICFARDGNVVRSEILRDSARLNFMAEVVNDSDDAKAARVRWQVIDAGGHVVTEAVSQPQTVDAWKQASLTGQIALQNPRLWSCENPYLCRLHCTLEAGGVIKDQTSVSFGIRSVKFDADHGFFLNGKPVKIKGTCNHQDHAGVGAALPDRLQSYRLERLKSMGSNAIRTSHNCPTPELIEAANRLGMLVLCETRMMDSSAEGLSQLERMVRRFRNAPSVVLWSLGNEEPEQGNSRGIRTVSSMKRLIRHLDPTRLVTVAQNGAFGKGISAVVDVQGFNYVEESIDAFHKAFPKQPMIGTETASTLCTRGIYANDAAAGYVSSYDLNAPPWGKTAEPWWKIYAERPFLAGGFAWTGFDYRGEPTPYSWPCISSHFGILDTCGFPKDNYFYYKAWWGAEPVLHLFPHWNWEAGKIVDVWVHSNLESVELFLNGRSLGAKKVEPYTHLAWSVPYEPGTIEARGSKSGHVLLTERRETSGAPAKLVLTADRETIDANGEDVAVISVSVQDAAGRIVPTASNHVRFRVNRVGRLLGVGNGDPSCHEADNGDGRSAFNGMCMALVQASRSAGEITIEAEADGIAGARLKVATAKTEPLPAVAEFA